MAPLVDELVPCPDPWAVARKLAHLPHLLFLDSADRHPDRGRYSYVTADPAAVATDFDHVAAAAGRRPSPTVPGLPPFQGGWAGLFGYGLGRRFERLPGPRADEFALPDVAVGRYDWVVAFDHAQDRGWLVWHPTDGRRKVRTAGGLRELLDGPEPPLPVRPSGNGGNGARTDRRDFLPPPLRGTLGVRAGVGGERPATLPAAWALGAQPSHPGPYPEGPPQGGREEEGRVGRGGPRGPTSVVPRHPLPGFPGVTSNFSADGYREAVRRAVEYVRAGDVFQVNLSQRLLAPLAEHPLELYGRLRAVNPAPFACYFDAGDFQVVSASPERFLRVDADGWVSTTPIKGTRRRGATPAEDQELARDLLASPKDRAENVMIVDLLRNDLGRVCEVGSIAVPRVCELETYRFVHHLVSEVRGKLRPGAAALDLLRAAFPGGSVTGAPKVRAMEVIAELEPTARGPYCGSVGWVGFGGAMDTNILIRTFTAAAGWVQFPVGGGVVADSDPGREYDETLAKAAGLLRALTP